jgi:TPR repeat protein
MKRAYILLPFSPERREAHVSAPLGCHSRGNSVTSSVPSKSPSIRPRWVIFAFLIAVLSALLIGALCALLPAATPARADAVTDDVVLRDADADLTRGEYVHALGLLTPLATRGNDRAQAMLAKAYDGVLEQADSDASRGEYAHALTLLTPLATRGDGRAQARLANIYLGHLGAPHDAALALQWAQKSVAQNSPDGLILLSQMYLEGDGVPGDAAQAMALIRRAVALDSAEAKARLGVMIIHGQGTASDPVAGRKWLMAASKQGLFGAQVWLGRVVLNEGTGLGASLPIGGAESPDAKVPSVPAKLRKAAEAGDAAAQLAVGRGLYAHALRKGGDVVDALPWIEKSATSGNIMAQFAAGALYVDGTHGVPDDRVKAQAWFAKGVAQLP